MREEHRHLVENWPPALLSLLAGSIDAHNDVAQHVAGERAELTLVHRERENVRGTIFMPIGFVQLMDVFVVG